MEVKDYTVGLLWALIDSQLDLLLLMSYLEVLTAKLVVTHDSAFSA